MTAGIPAGFVDPLDAGQVASVLTVALERLGMTGLVELLSRIPGLRIDPGQAGGLFRPARPARVFAGEEVVALTRPVVREHVVGGIVLGRNTVRPAEVPGLLAWAVCTAVADYGDAEQASVVLTSARDALGSAGAPPN
ncbi:MAG: hypothetical protein M3042_13180 [Actinomycetota bacterium]|nr:hypothetical protein [Actinomycetota bacterium]